MIFSSALNSFKRDFGGVFMRDFQVDSSAELTSAEYADTLTEVDRKTLMTMDEQDREEAEMESAKAMGKGNQATNAIMGMDLKVDSVVPTQLAAFAGSSIDTLLLSWSSETELIEVECAEALGDWKSATAKLPTNEPRYLLHRYTHTRAGCSEATDAVVFVYYCPDSAKPRLKMSYSTLKRHVQSAVSKADIHVTKSLEASDMGDVSEQAVLDELYPPVVEQAVHVKPVSIKAKGKRRMVGKKKFTPMA
jgi:hypothetical protein